LLVKGWASPVLPAVPPVVAEPVDHLDPKVPLFPLVVFLVQEGVIHLRPLTDGPDQLTWRWRSTSKIAWTSAVFIPGS
jgi:hypothetical protein